MRYAQFTIVILVCLMSCVGNNVRKGDKPNAKHSKITAADILGNADYQAVAYGGYRSNSRSIPPSEEEIKEDLKLLSAMGIKLIRTYNVHLPHTHDVLRAINSLQEEDPSFEMYVMLGAWIDCKNAWTDEQPNHQQESERNEIEIQTAVTLAKAYPNIVKIIAVGNEAMVKWATNYYVEPRIILKWVNYLQEMKSRGELSSKIWITSSDNFASWGGGSDEYHTEDLNQLIKAVDYLSIHTYPMHDTHYNPIFWELHSSEKNKSKEEKVKILMQKALVYAKSQYDAVNQYVLSLGVEKPIHIGETGWTSNSNGLYGLIGSKAADEYKSALFYHMMRAWTNQKGISCFYFEAFDEPWKDAQNPKGSENHFGLFTVDGRAKYALWDLVDKGVFKGLKRGENTIVKTHHGDIETLMETVHLTNNYAN